MLSFLNKAQETSKEDFNFNRLLQPISPSNFLSEYWEQRPLIISKRESNYYDSLFSINNFDDVIYFSECKYPDLRLLKDGQVLPQAYECKDRFSSINRIYEAYNQGSTIVLDNLQFRWKPLAFFCRSLETFLSHTVNINSYLTPQSSQGFSAHFDTHEVFILQISGSKIWRIYEQASLLPLDTDKKNQFVSKSQLGNLLYEITLNSGDLLYIPRGYVHEALTSKSSSLHLTLGIDTFKWTDIISYALKLVSQQNVSFRKSLSVGFLNQNEQKEYLKNHFKELLELLSQNAVFDEAVEQLPQVLIEKMLPLPGEQFTQINNLDHINPNTVVKKREGMLCYISREEDSVSIQFPGGKVKGPIYIEPALNFIANSEDFLIKDISSNISDNSKLILIRFLLKQGLLTIIAY
jgi:ribosomal protein L16 Arg81 hydroxylase